RKQKLFGGKSLREIDLQKVSQNVSDRIRPPRTQRKPALGEDADVRGSSRDVSRNGAVPPSISAPAYTSKRARDQSSAPNVVNARDPGVVQAACLARSTSAKMA